MKSNFFLNSDSYKLGHFLQYPANTAKIYEYIESRKDINVLFFGLQMYLKKLNASFPTMTDVEFAKVFAEKHGVCFNYEGAKALVELGYFPLRIKAVKEGTYLSGKNVLVTIENTHPDFEWLVGILETQILRAVWYPSTVATYSKELKIIISKYLLETQGSIDSLPFKMHDFGARSSTSTESSGIGGAAHLVNFMGTDTMEGIMATMEYYDSDMSGFSVVAAEHSTITSWGEEGELDAYSNLIDTFPTGILSVVSDSYDLERAVRDYFGKQLKDKILARDGVFVVRPDSGEPVEVVMSVLGWLEEGFGSYKNNKNYKVLNDKVRIIQGDGVDLNKIEEILETMKNAGWSAENLVFGMGTKLLQNHSRDDLSFAMKVSYIEDDKGNGMEVFKNPKGDSSKKSKRGRLALVKEDGKYVTINKSQLKGREDMLKDVYIDGKLVNEMTFDEVREQSML